MVPGTPERVRDVYTGYLGRADAIVIGEIAAFHRADDLRTGVDLVNLDVLRGEEAAWISTLPTILNTSCRPSFFYEMQEVEAGERIVLILQEGHPLAMQPIDSDFGRFLIEGATSTRPELETQ